MNLTRCLILMLTIGGGLLIRAEENPYTPIVSRNVFGLVPIPVHDPANDVPATPPPKITPNGIMTIFGKIQALFKVAGMAKPGQPAKDESYVLGEGERQDDIEVQKIDEPAAIITFNNHGTIQALPLVVGKVTGGAPAPTASTGGIPLPARGVAAARGGSPAPIVIGGNRSIPNGNNAARSNAPGLGGGGASNGNAASTEPLSPEAQIIMIEANRAKMLDDGDPAAVIMPTTPITQQVIGNGQSEDENPSNP